MQVATGGHSGGSKPKFTSLDGISYTSGIYRHYVLWIEFYHFCYVPGGNLYIQQGILQSLGAIKLSISEMAANTDHLTISQCRNAASVQDEDATTIAVMKDSNLIIWALFQTTKQVEDHCLKMNQYMQECHHIMLLRSIMANLHRM